MKLRVPPSSVPFRITAVVAVASFAIVSSGLLGAITLRHSLVYLGVTGAVVLPIASSRLGFLRAGLLFAAVALVLVLVPLDFKLESTGRHRVRVLPVWFGVPPSGWDSRVVPEGVHYGCEVPRNRARFAVVIEY